MPNDDKIRFSKGGGLTIWNDEANNVIRIKTKQGTNCPTQFNLYKGSSPPSIEDGTVLFYNTNLNEIFFYDIGRAKWLSTSVYEYIFGMDTADNSLLVTPGSNPGLLGVNDNCGYYVHTTLTLVEVVARARTGVEGKEINIQTFDTNEERTTVHSFNMSGTNPCVGSSYPNVDIDNTCLGVFVAAAGGALTNVAIKCCLRKRIDS